MLRRATLLAAATAALGASVSMGADRPPAAIPFDTRNQDTQFQSEIDPLQHVMHELRRLVESGVITGTGGDLAAAAQHIIDQQCPNGGFGWPHDDCGATFNNITGPICLGLIRLYERTPMISAYIDAALAGGDYDLGFQYGNGESRFGAAAPHFLWQLSGVSGDSTYADHAATDFFDELTADTYGPDDLDTAEWIAVVQTARTGTWVNLRPWEFHNLVDAAAAIGNAGQEGLFVQAVLDGLATLDNTDPDNVYSDIIGITGGVYGLAVSGTTTFTPIVAPNHALVNGVDDLCELADVLKNLQNTDGSWYWHSNLVAPGEDDKDTQTSAYALLALLAAQQHGGCVAPGAPGAYDEEIRLARTWIASMQDVDGGFLSYPGGDHNTEVEGEALTALASSGGGLTLETDPCPPDVSGDPGHQIVVEVWMRDLLQDTTGFQAFISFDDTKLDYRGDLSAYTGSPFSLHIQDIDMAQVGTGLLNIDGSDAFGGTGTDVDSLLATLVFEHTEACETTEIAFDTSGDFDSELSVDGVPVATDLVTTGPFTLDSVAPVITDCPGDIVTPADAGVCTAVLAVIEPFESPVSTCATQTPDCWYVDRYAPAVFETAVFDGDDRLCHGVDVADAEGNRPAGFNTPFYNTQGRKYDIDLPVGATLGADLYLPSDWAASDRRAGLWGTTFDSNGDISGFPIIGFTSEGGPPRFRIFTQDIDQDPDNGFDPGWIDLLTVVDFDQWYRFETTLTAAAYEFRVIDLTTEMVVASFDDVVTLDSVKIGNVILQVYNFGETYNAYWDNVTLGPAGPEVSDNCTFATLTFERSDDPMLTLADPFPPGTTTITWTATDECGNEAVCEQDVTVTSFNEVEVTVVLSGSDPLESPARCIQFVPDDCGEAFSSTLFFSGDPATATATILVGCGDWDFVCAKDEQLTKWFTSTVSIVGSTYVADTTYVLDPGDTDNDGDVDINDVTLLLVQFGSDPDDGGCPWNGMRSADFSNDDNVFSEDYDLLVGNWLTLSECACASPAGLPPVLTQLDASELPTEMADLADLNGDGWVDFFDVEIFEAKHGLPHHLSARIMATEMYQDR